MAPIEPVGDLSIDGRFVVVSDGDQAGTAYGFGKLRREEGVEDALTTVSFEPEPTVSSLPVSNSVVSWPQVVDFDPDGRAWVVETRGRPEDGVKKVGDVYKDLPDGTRITALDVSGAPTELGSADFGTNPDHISIHPDGGWAVANSWDPDAQLLFASLSGIDVGSVHKVVLHEQKGLRDQVTGVRWNPDGDVLAVLVGFRDVRFYRVSGLESGKPEVTQIGDAARAGNFLSAGTWTPDGRHYIVADTNWRPFRASFLFNGPGRIASVGFDERGGPVLVDVQNVGRSTEGMAMSEDGTRVVAVNMNRSFLPRVPTYLGWPGGLSANLSLLGVNPDGTLDMLHKRANFPAVLPEDAAFDADGDALLVVNYHDRAKHPTQGWVDVWKVDGDALVRTDMRIEMPRGPHDIELVP